MVHMYIDLLNTIEDNEYPIDFSQKGDNELFEGRSITFDSEINVRGSYVSNKDVVTVNATIYAKLKGECDNCLEEIFWDLELPLYERFTMNASEEGYSYTKDRVELDDAIKDKIILTLPSKLLCKNDCKGLCAKCGCDMNKEQCECNKDTDDKNPFAILKSIVGGAKDGSTKV